MLEKNLQYKFKKMLQSAGFLVYKIGGEQNRGLPDLMIVGHGVLQLVEIKTEKGKLSKLQSATIDKLKNAGANVEVWNNVEQCKNFIKRTTKRD